ncbi:MAG: PQQ-binding-like beta-propeller repeat protein [Acidobacteria bacterium]|nr:PQQ-binding-like beta-propeller repeat protein [Acidobacteriota bacterium]
MRSRPAAGAIAISLTAIMAVTLTVHAQDWPQWRGPNRDGAIASFTAPDAWPTALTRRWQVEVGTGYATPLVVGDRVYTFTRQGEDEVLTAFDAASAKQLWRAAYPAAFSMNPAARQHGPGPKSTPTHAGGRIFTLGMTGVVLAFDAREGRVLWQAPAPPVQPMYHTAMSPLVDGNLVIVHVGGHDRGALTAFEVATGKVAWQWTGDGPAYGSPIIATLSGTKQVVTFTQENLVGVHRDTGALLWRRPFTTPATTTSQTPIVHRDMVIESGRDNGFTAFRPTLAGSAWTTPDVWQTRDVSVHMSDVVAVDGVVYGLSHLNRGQYFALDLETGKVLWTGEPRRAEHAAMARAGSTIFSLEDDGELVVMRASRTGFEPVAQYEVATSATWAQPAISGGRIFVKDVSSLTLWTVD